MIWTSRSEAQVSRSTTKFCYYGITSAAEFSGLNRFHRMPVVFRFTARQFLPLVVFLSRFTRGTAHKGFPKRVDIFFFLFYWTPTHSLDPSTNHWLHSTTHTQSLDPPGNQSIKSWKNKPLFQHQFLFLSLLSSSWSAAPEAWLVDDTQKDVTSAPPPPRTPLSQHTEVHLHHIHRVRRMTHKWN